VKTFDARFRRWDYDGVFGNGTVPKKYVEGSLKYASPDKGYYHLDDDSEKWICTGDAIFEFRLDLKKVREHRLPENMRGKAISDGPLPFVFGVEAAKMRARYWLRITTPAEAAEKNQVWIEAYPKFAKDAANFSRVDVILSFTFENGVVTKLEPHAINLVMPNQKDRTAYQFTQMTTNGVLNNLGETLGIFVRPATPLGWQHELMDDGMATGTEPSPAAGPAAGIGSAPQSTVPR
jgi:TIGR03009 family protein